MPFHELGHIQLDQGIFTAKQEARQGFGQLGLADAGRSQEDEGADRAAGVFQAGTCPAHGFGDRFDGFFLPDDVLRAVRLPCAAGARILRSAICITGTPVHMETTSAISSAVTTGAGVTVPGGAEFFELSSSSSVLAQFQGFDLVRLVFFLGLDQLPGASRAVGR